MKADYYNRKNSLYIYFFGFICIAITGVLHAQIAVRGEIVHTVSGPSIREGIVLIHNGKIEAVGPTSEVEIPPDYKTYNARVVTPGLIDAHSVVGLSGIYNQSHDQDQLDKTQAIQPELRALDAYNPQEKLVEWLRDFGITTVHTGHAPGALVNGKSLIVKTHGDVLQEVLIDGEAMMTFTLGETVGHNFSTPGTRSKGVAMIRSELLKAQNYIQKMKTADEKPDRDLRMEALGEVLERKIPALITANRATEIMSALRLADEFRFNLVLDGAAEVYLVIDEIKAAGIPVIIHPTMVRNYGDTRNASFETAKKLQDAGILFAFQSGYESYVPKTRVILYEAAIAVTNGLNPDDAIAAMTINPARILGIDKKVGSITEGKDADLVLFDGDPFEYTSHVCTVILNGEVVSNNCR